MTKHLSFRVQIDDKEGEASSNENLGTVFLSLVKYDKAKEYLKKAPAIMSIIQSQAAAISHAALRVFFSVKPKMRQILLLHVEDQTFLVLHGILLNAFPRRIAFVFQTILLHLHHLSKGKAS